MMSLPPGYISMVPKPVMVPIAMPGMQIPGHPAAALTHGQQSAIFAPQSLQSQPGLIGTMPPHLHQPTLLSPYAASLQAGQYNPAAGLLGSMTPQSAHGLMSPVPQALSSLQAMSPLTSPLAQSSFLLGSPMQARLPISSPYLHPQFLTAEQLQAIQEAQLSMLDPNYQLAESAQSQQLAVPKTKTELEAEAKPFILDDYNSDLNLIIGDDGYGGHAMTNPEGFCFCWAGARATQGVTQGKVYFEVHITEHLPVTYPPDHQETDPHIVRVGWSTDATSMQLGEEEYSYGYGGTGKFSYKCKFSDYGNKFCAGDVVGALLDLESKPPNISFMKNGKWLTVAHNLRGFAVGQADMALFPHILSKNCRFKVNFGQMPAWFSPPPGFVFVNQTPSAHRIVGQQAPKLISDCEIIMVIGLPGAGKTTWANKTKKDNPDKRFNIIGTDTLIDRMRVNGLARKRNYAGRWDVLIDRATKCLNKMFIVGGKRCRNYILDQTNVYPTAQARKMKHFRHFKRRAAILVTDDQELQRRSKKRTEEDGKVVPESAVLEMKAHFKIPEKDSAIFDEVTFIEWPRERAMPLVSQYNQEGKMASQGGGGGGGQGHTGQPTIRPQYMYGGYAPVGHPPAIHWNMPPPQQQQSQQYPPSSTALESIKNEYTGTQENWMKPQTSSYQSYAGGYQMSGQTNYSGIKQEPNIVSTWSASQDWQAKPPVNSRMYPSATSNQGSWGQSGYDKGHQQPARSQTLTVVNTTGDGTTSPSHTKQARSPSPQQGDDPMRKRQRRSKWDTPDEADSTDIAAENSQQQPTEQINPLQDSSRHWQGGENFHSDDNIDSKDWFKGTDVKPDIEIKQEDNCNVPCGGGMDKSNNIRQADSTTDPGNFPHYFRGRGGPFRGRPPFRGGPPDMRFRPFGPPRFPPHGPMDRFGPPPHRGFMPPRYGPPPMGGPPRFPPRMGGPRFPRQMPPRGPMN